MAEINIVWSFEDTEFEDVGGDRYDYVVELVGLPNSIDLEDFDLDETDNIDEALYEHFGFKVESWEFDE